jgi:hypothetical protein
MSGERGVSRPMSLAEHASLLWVIASIADSRIAGSLYRQSLEVLVSVESTTCMLNFELGSDQQQVDLPNGPLPITANVYSGNGELAGEILVWVNDGLLSAMEYPWFTDQMPTVFPNPDALRHA